jgi:2-keto-4-pentenoate hydratase
MNTARIEEGARRLAAAWRTGEAIASALAAGAPVDLDEAYAIQAASLAGIGGRPIGYKIGCTNESAQALLGVDAPFHGRLLSDYAHASPARLEAGALRIRILEPEIAFRLGSDLPAGGAPCDAASVRPAIAAVMGAIEVVDTRYLDWLTVGALNLVADNASAGHWVCGAESADVDAVDYQRHPVLLSLNGEVRERGVAGNALGSSLNALAWLANALARRGGMLRAGDLVTTGTCTKVIPAEKGDVASADFGPLGQVEVRFD